MYRIVNNEDVFMLCGSVDAAVSMSHCWVSWRCCQHVALLILASVICEWQVGRNLERSFLGLIKVLPLYLPGGTEECHWQFRIYTVLPEMLDSRASNFHDPKEKPNKYFHCFCFQLLRHNTHTHKTPPTSKLKKLRNHSTRGQVCCFTVGGWWIRKYFQENHSVF